MIDAIPVISQFCSDVFFTSPRRREFLYFLYFPFSDAAFPLSCHRTNQQDPACKRMSSAGAVRRSAGGWSHCLLPAGGQLLADHRAATCKAASPPPARPEAASLPVPGPCMFYLLVHAEKSGYSLTEKGQYSTCQSYFHGDSLTHELSRGKSMVRGETRIKN